VSGGAAHFEDCWTIWGVGVTPAPRLRNATTEIPRSAAPRQRSRGAPMDYDSTPRRTSTLPARLSTRASCPERPQRPRTRARSRTTRNPRGAVGVHGLHAGRGESNPPTRAGDTDPPTRAGDAAPPRPPTLGSICPSSRRTTLPTPAPCRESRWLRLRARQRCRRVPRAVTNAISDAEHGRWRFAPRRRRWEPLGSRVPARTRPPRLSALPLPQPLPQASGEGDRAGSPWDGASRRAVGAPARPRAGGRRWRFAPRRRRWPCQTRITRAPRRRWPFQDQNHACASQAMALPDRITRAPRRRWPFQTESRMILVWQGPPKVPKVTQSRNLRAQHGAG